MTPEEATKAPGGILTFEDHVEFFKHHYSGLNRKQILEYLVKGKMKPEAIERFKGLDTKRLKRDFFQLLAISIMNKEIQKNEGQ